MFRITFVVDSENFTNQVSHVMKMTDYRRIRKIVTIDHVLRRVCPSAWNNVAPTGRIFINLVLFSKIRRDRPKHVEGCSKIK